MTGSVQSGGKQIGLLHSLIRKDEKMLLDAFKRANVSPVMIDDRKLIMDFETAPEIDVLLERCLLYTSPSPRDS